MLDTRFFTFLVLCQTKSFTKTAEELHITQPAVSHHIKYLEEYYNVKLYTYVGKKFHLTTSGEVLYQFVSSFYTDSERIKEQLGNPIPLPPCCAWGQSSLLENLFCLI